MHLDHALRAPLFLAMFEDHGIIASLIIGLIIGAIAKALMPGKDPGGCIITIVLGLAGAFVGTFLGRTIFGDQYYYAGWIASIIGAMLLLWIYRIASGRSRP